MTDRETQAFRAVYSFAEEQVPEAPDWERIKAPQIALASEPAPGRRPAVVLFAGALAALLLVGGIMLGIRFLGNGAGDDAAGTVPVTTAAPPVTTAAVPVTTAAVPVTTAADAPATTSDTTVVTTPAAGLPAAADLAAGWELIDSATSGLGPWRKLMDVIAVGDGFLAAGMDMTFALSDGSGAVFHSGNGLTWTETMLAGPGEGPPAVDRIYATGMGYLMTGERWLPIDAGSEGVHGPGDGYTTLEIGVWHSADGASWTWVPLYVIEYGIEGFSEDYSVSEIVEGDRGLLLLATHQVHGAASEVLVYTSADGLTWERAAVPEAFAGSGVLSLAAGAGRFVATGWGPQGLVEPRVWVSDDGISWEVIGDPFPTGFGPHQIVPGGPGFVATGSTASGAMILTSADALTWAAAQVEGPQIEILGITTVPGGLVATGLDEMDGGPGPVLWLSADGLVWERVIPDPEVFSAAPSPEGPAEGGEIPMEPVFINGLFFADDRLVAFGEFTSSEGSEDGAVWVWTPPGS